MTSKAAVAEGKVGRPADGTDDDTFAPNADMLLRKLMEPMEQLDDELGDEEEDPEEYEAFAAMIKQVEAKRSAKAKHKQVFILTDLANNIKQQAKQVEGLVAKEAQEAETAAAAPLTSLNRKLEGKWKAITALQGRFQSELSKLWGEYEEVYREVESAKAQAQGAAGKRMAGAKRKVQQLEKGAGEQLAEAGRTLSKLNAGSKKDKLTDFLTKLMKSPMA